MATSLFNIIGKNIVNTTTKAFYGKYTHKMLLEVKHISYFRHWKNFKTLPTEAIVLSEIRGHSYIRSVSKKFQTQISRILCNLIKHKDFVKTVFCYDYCYVYCNDRAILNDLAKTANSVGCKILSVSVPAKDTADELLNGVIYENSDYKYVATTRAQRMNPDLREVLKNMFITHSAIGNVVISQNLIPRLAHPHRSFVSSTKIYVNDLSIITIFLLACPDLVSKINEIKKNPNK